jgi:hypothetical protein
MENMSRRSHVKYKASGHQLGGSNKAFYLQTDAQESEDARSTNKL